MRITRTLVYEGDPEALDYQLAFSVPDGTHSILSGSATLTITTEFTKGLMSDIGEIGRRSMLGAPGRHRADDPKHPKQG